MQRTFGARVNMAAQYIAEGRKSTRAFESCLEMDDGELVAVALYRRAQKNQALAANLFTYLSEDITRAEVQRYQGISTRDLSRVAASLRQDRQEAWKKKLAAWNAAQGRGPQGE